MADGVAAEGHLRALIAPIVGTQSCWCAPLTRCDSGTTFARQPAPLTCSSNWACAGASTRCVTKPTGCGTPRPRPMTTPSEPEGRARRCRGAARRRLPSAARLPGGLEAERRDRGQAHRGWSTPAASTTSAPPTRPRIGFPEDYFPYDPNASRPRRTTRAGPSGRPSCEAVRRLRPDLDDATALYCPLPGWDRHPHEDRLRGGVHRGPRSSWSRRQRDPVGAEEAERIYPRDRADRLPDDRKRHAEPRTAAATRRPRTGRRRSVTTPSTARRMSVVTATPDHDEDHRERRGHVQLQQGHPPTSTPARPTTPTGGSPRWAGPREFPVHGELRAHRDVEDRRRAGWIRDGWRRAAHRRPW